MAVIRGFEGCFVAVLPSYRAASLTSYGSSVLCLFRTVDKVDRRAVLIALRMTKITGPRSSERACRV